MAEEGDGGGHNYFQWEGGKFPHQEEQMKIPKIDEDSQNRWEAEEGVGVSGAQGQLDDAVGVFRFSDGLMLTQKKKSQLNGMDCNCNYPFAVKLGGGGFRGFPFP